MELLFAALLIIILVVLLNYGGNISRQLARLEAEVDQLRRHLLKNTGTTLPAEQTQQPVQEVVQSQPGVLPQQVDPVITEEPVQPAPEAFTLPVTESAPAPATVVEMPETIIPPAVTVTPTPSIKAPADIEKFIGENLVSKIGIGILVLAIGFFVKYAIDNNWIGPVGRVSVGMLCGCILIVLAHRLRKNYVAFSSVLVGGGIGAFYFTITLAYQQFHLFEQLPAFIIMIIITAFAAILSLLYNRQELAVIAIVGGFAAPFMVSTGSGNYITLFTYMALLNCGLLAIAYFKSWRLLNVIAFIFTTLIFTGWLATEAFSNTVSRWLIYRNGFIFATVFYLQFFLISIACQAARKVKFLTLDFVLLLINTCVYAGLGLICLHAMNEANVKGFFSVALGLFNLLASWLLLRRTGKRTTILYLLIGITLTFISLAAPLQLNGNYITLFWASETVLLFWLYQRSRIYLMQLASVMIWVAMLISLLIDWGNIYFDFSRTAMTIIANKGFITGVYAAVATFLLLLLRKRYDAWPVKINGMLMPGQAALYTASMLLLYLSGALEIMFQLGQHYPGSGIRLLYLFLFSMLFVFTLLFISRRSVLLRISNVVVNLLLILAVVFYLLLISSVYGIQAELITSARSQWHFTAHWLGVLTFIILLVQLARQLKKDNDSERFSFDFEGVAWVMCAVGVIVVTVELQLLANQLFYSATRPLAGISRVYTRTGMPVVWGLCSFALMWAGMKYRYRTLRIISLALFALTLVKLFIFDIRDISAAGKIIAFFCLGVLLLLVSFMYQRLKKIIIDDDNK